MTEPSASPTPPDPNLETQTINPTDVGDAGTVLGLGGVAAQATVGSLDPQTGAAPAADQPAADQPAAAPPAAAATPEGSTLEPTGPAPDAAAANPTATPGATNTAAPTSTPVPAQGMSLVEREVRSNLNAIEQLALFWGGETGTKIRNHIGRIRELLQ